MATRIEKKAVRTFKQGHNCAQAILAAFSSKTNMNMEQSIRLGNPFGAGMGFKQETCGVVTGALIVPGLIKGAGDLKDQKKREKCYDNTRLFLEKFTARHGDILCRELVHCDITTPEGKKAAEQDGVYTKRCVPLIISAVQIIEEILAGE